MKKKLIPKGYAYTNRYSFSKKKAEERADKARKAGYVVKVVPAKTKIKGTQGYALVAKTTKKGYGWFKKKK